MLNKEKIQLLEELDGWSEFCEEQEMKDATLAQMKAAILNDKSWQVSDCGNGSPIRNAIDKARTWDELNRVAPHSWSDLVANRVTSRDKL